MTAGRLKIWNAGTSQWEYPAGGFAAHAASHLGGSDDIQPTIRPRLRGASPGAVCFCWDDGLSAHYSSVASLHEARGQRATFGIVSDFLGTAGYMTSSQMLALFNRGHEIASHSKSHAQTNGTGVQSLSTSDRVAEYDTSKTAIEAVIGSGACTSWIYPYGGRSAGTDSELALRYDRIRGITGSTTGLNWMVPMSDRDDFLFAGISWDGTSTQQAILLNAIRMAARMPVIVVVYGHDPDAASNPTTTQITAALDLVQTLGVDTLTLKEAFPGGNLLRNPGFEDGSLNDWVPSISGGVGTAEVVSDSPASGYPGSYSAHLVSDGSATVFIRQQVPAVRPGQSYQLSGRYRVTGTPGSGVTAVIRERDYTGTVISQSATSALTATSWTQFAVARALGATARVVWIDLQVAAAACEVWFDHVYFQRQAIGAQG